MDTAIKNVKAGKIETNKYIHELNHVLQVYKEKGISTLLEGCTETPLLILGLNFGLKNSYLKMSQQDSLTGPDSS